MKDGIDYMQLNVYISSEWRLLIAEHGHKALSVLFLLHQMIYAEKGYYTEWDDDRALLIALSAGDLNVADIQKVVQSAVAKGIFHREIFERYKVLTSVEIQNHYMRVVRRRKTILNNAQYVISDELNTIVATNQPKQINVDYQKPVVEEKSEKVEPELVISDDVLKESSPLGSTFNVLPPTIESQIDITKNEPTHNEEQQKVSPKQVFAAYRKFCPNLEKLQVETKEREIASLELAKAFTLTQICHAFQAMDENTWNRGDNANGWVANFDYCVQPQKVESYLGRAAFAKSAQKYRDCKPPKNPVVMSNQPRKYGDLTE